MNPGSMKKYAAPAILCAAAALALQRVAGNTGQGGVIFLFAGKGWALLYGIRDPMVSLKMPLLSVLMTFMDHEPRRLALAVNAALLLLFFSAYNLGCMKGGKFTGALYALAAVLASFLFPVPQDPEQVFFALLIGLYLNVDAAAGEKPGPLRSLLAGLALGGTLLMRSTLALFPLLRAALILRSDRPRRALLKEAAAFLLGSYILLAPWTMLNYRLSGGLNPLESGRVVSNLVTGVKGSVYTMEGDAMALAGLRPGESVVKWAALQVAREPGAYLAAVVRRLWQVFLMFPYLVLLAAAGLWYRRKKPDTPLAALAAYFLLAHCLLSIEKRYFYPLVYLLAFLAAGGGAALLGADGGKSSGGARAAYALFLPVLGFMLAVEGLAAAYPFRISGDRISGLEAALKEHPGRPWLLASLGQELAGSRRAEEGLAALRVAAARGGAKYSELVWIPLILDSPRPAGIRANFDREFSAPLFTGLRQLELGQEGDGAKSLVEAYEKWNSYANMLRGTPYERDKAILAELRLKNRSFQDRQLFEALLYWPPARRPVLMDRLEKVFPLSGRLSLLRFMSAPPRPRDLKALAGLAGEADVIDNAGADERRAAAEQLTRYLLPLKKTGGYGGVPGAVFALLGKAETGIELSTAAFDSGPVSAEELRLLAGQLTGGSPGAAPELYALRPASPLYLYLSLKKPEEAAAALLKNPGLLLACAGSYAAKGDARAGLLAAAALGSGTLTPDQLRRAALALQSAGQYREALAAADKLAAALPGDWRALNDRGVLHMLLGDKKKAGTDLARALELEPRAWQAMLNLAALRLGEGLPAEADGLYAAALRCPGLPAEVKDRLTAPRSKPVDLQNRPH